MDSTSWVIIDTETTGLHRPIFVVEIAAQRMRGWMRDGPPFRRLLNHGTDIPPEAARVHGYTREILERDGDDPPKVYREFADYAAGLPICAYNLDYDWDEVLIPEWQRLGLPAVGARGFCLLQLTQRLLDPVPAGNCKLQTLRQYYGLPARGAHTAIGDVETVVDLLQRVLRPLCEMRGLLRFDDLVAFSQTPWFPARIPFGKFKGRHFRDARHDPNLRNWLVWLADSDHPRSRAMGRWYLDQLDTIAPRTVTQPLGTSLAIYRDPAAARLEMLIEGARNRLVELEAEYTSLHQAVSVTQYRLFLALQEEYRLRDLLRIRIDLLRKSVNALLCEGENEAERYESQCVQEEARIRGDYERMAAAAAGKRILTEQEETEVKELWRKLVKLFHPDRYAADPMKQAAYEHLTRDINRARDEGDLNRLREIATDPQGYLARQGLPNIVIAESQNIEALERLYDTLQGQILELIEALDALRQSPAYELYCLLNDDPVAFEEVTERHRKALRSEIDALQAEIREVEAELSDLKAH